MLPSTRNPRSRPSAYFPSVNVQSQSHSQSHTHSHSHTYSAVLSDSFPDHSAASDSDSSPSSISHRNYNSNSNSSFVPQQFISTPPLSAAASPAIQPIRSGHSHRFSNFKKFFSSNPAILKLALLIAAAAILFAVLTLAAILAVKPYSGVSQSIKTPLIINQNEIHHSNEISVQPQPQIPTSSEQKPLELVPVDHPVPAQVPAIPTVAIAQPVPVKIPAAVVPSVIVEPAISPSVRVNSFLSPTSSISWSAAPFLYPSDSPIDSAPHYSSFHCIGDRGRLGSEDSRSCHFRSVCYDFAVSEWIFYRAPAAKSYPVLNDEGRIITEFPTRFLSLTSSDSKQSSSSRYMKFRVLDSAIPLKSPSPTTPIHDISSLKTSFLFYQSFSPSNLFNWLYNDFFPLFNLMASFALLNPSNQLIMNQNCEEFYNQQDNKLYESQVQLCQTWMKLLSPTISHIPPISLSSLASVVALPAGSYRVSPSLVCFSRLLSGSGPWSQYSSWGKQPQLLAFRHFMLSNIGLNPHEIPTRIKIAISNPKKRGFANFKSVESWIREYFKESTAANEIEIVLFDPESFRLAKMNRQMPTAAESLNSLDWNGFVDEIRFLQSISILLTPCGAVSATALFLPLNSAMIQIGYFNPSMNETQSGEEKFWPNVGHLRVLNYKIDSIEEIQLESGKSWKWNDYQHYSHVNIQKEKIIKLIRIAINHVKAFMKRREE